ncbi:tetratricopeptide repeat protein [Niveibacterium sp.]|uniref:tetratricopeptide repeat protein n=1 Tax=Niveibacterium sp. TaxID=2017444 RepID=UPI0035B17BE3
MLRSILAALLVATASIAAVAAEPAPTSAATLIARADKYWTEGKLDKAGESFAAAVAAEPKSSATLLRLAGFQLSLQEISKSVATYRQVITLEPKNSKAWIGMGLAYLHSGDTELARAALDEAIRVDPARKESLKPLLAKLDERSH